MQNDDMYAKFNIYYKLFIYESGSFTLYKLIKNHYNFPFKNPNENNKS